MSDIKLEPMDDSSLPLRDVVFKTLRKAILKGQLQPGKRLMEIHLADALGVSRTPVREAIRKLELEGLVIMTPRKGAQVARISRKHLEDIVEVRRALEVLAVELACDRIDESALKELDEINQNFRDSLYISDPEQMAQINDNFHDIIFQAAGNEWLMQLMMKNRDQFYRYKIEHLKSRNSKELMVDEHQKIIDALRQRDTELACKTMREHIKKHRDAVLLEIEAMEKDPWAEDQKEG